MADKKEKKETKAKEKKQSESENRLKELKIELLKQAQKRKNIKKEIARLLTVGSSTKLEDKK